MSRVANTSRAAWRLRRRSFRCDSCGGTFWTGWSDAEARAEADRLFGLTSSDIDAGACAEVCDPCFQRMTKSYPPADFMADQRADLGAGPAGGGVYSGLQAFAAEVAALPLFFTLDPEGERQPVSRDHPFNRMGPAPRDVVACLQALASHPATRDMGDSRGRAHHARRRRRRGGWADA